VFLADDTASTLRLGRHYICDHKHERQRDDSLAAGGPIIRWLFPAQGELRVGWRLLAALVVNLALAVYVLPHHEHLWDMRDYRYVQVGTAWIFAIVGVPSAILLLLLPVVFSKQIMRRWPAVFLAIFPGYLAVAGWIQLLMIWAGDR